MPTSDNLERFSKIAQSAAVILGVAFAVYELVLKDREQERQFVELTLKQVEAGQSKEVQEARKRLFALKDLAYATPTDGPGDQREKDQRMAVDVSSRFDSDTRELTHFYNVIARCVEAGFCNLKLAQALICDDAERDLYAIHELQGRLGNKNLGPRFILGLLSLQNSCPGQAKITVDTFVKAIP